MIDILSNLIKLAQISGGIDTVCQLDGSWYLDNTANAPNAVLHMIVEGEGYLKIKGEPKVIHITKGDILFFPRGEAHILSSQSHCDNTLAIPYTKSQEYLTVRHSSGTVVNFKLFCAHFSYDKKAVLFQNLPRWFKVNLPDNQWQPLWSLLSQEIETKSGHQQIIDNLSTVLFTLILRTYLSEHGADTIGILHGMQDPRLAPLLYEIVKNPAIEWTISEMSKRTFLSRAQFIRIFKQQMGMTPHFFVQKIRLQQAAYLLKTTLHSVNNISALVGFQTETHFIKAFKKHYSITPKSYRIGQAENEHDDAIKIVSA
ncbi:hypothetical protein A6A19_07535 [Actinobacillus delphinicola]|uniref:AraC family transcriptional regulator n=1 Tax=Actinobacillus delphinicola TaxID=51161 RepID=A0A448TUM7_9PAST|nr:AraC family transcriptional regulator [Actinobacillus delphinicola]MDG6897827.1 hypothetical protein [Actinobacillus delphinicola]VEJ09702.1 AraC family transcriptional regulator [Actinobacillus delphinicola]